MKENMRIVKFNPSLFRLSKIKSIQFQSFSIVASVVVHPVTLVRGGVSGTIIGTLLRLLKVLHLHWWTRWPCLMLV